jgi:hypothetical protein
VDVSGQPQARVALPPEKGPPVPIERKAEWAPGSVWTLLRRGEPLASAGIRTPDRPAGSLATVPTTVFRIPLIRPREDKACTSVPLGRPAAGEHVWWKLPNEFRLNLVWTCAPNVLCDEFNPQKATLDIRT